MGRGMFAYRFLLLAVFSIVGFTQLSAAETASNTKPGKDYLLQIEGGLISLQATDVPLIQIVEDIGKQLDIQVVVQIPEDERVTVQFESLPLDEALQRLSQNHALMTDKDARTISKIFLLPKGQEAPMEQAVVSTPEPVSLPESSAQTTREARSGNQPESKESKPFEFTFDPSQFEPQNPR